MLSDFDGYYVWWQVAEINLCHLFKNEKRADEKSKYA